MTATVGLVRRNPPLLAAVAVDGAGTGLFLPFAVLYFQHTTAMTPAAIGSALTVAALIALPTPLVVGPLIDRYGARRPAIGGNLLSAAAFLAYPLVGGPGPLVAAAIVAAVGQSMSWTALVSLIGVLADPPERARWFAVQSTLRNVGYGLGGLSGALAVSLGGPAGYRWLAVLNAASFLAVAGILARTRAPAADPVTGGEARPGRYADLLHDRRLQLIVLTNLLLVVCMSMLSVLMTVYLTETLGQPAWFGGLLFTLNTVLVILAQTTVTGRVGRLHRPRIVQAAAAVWAFAFAGLWLLDRAPAGLVVPGAVVAVCACTLAEMLHAPTINALAVDSAPDGAVGRYLAVYQLSWGLGSAVAPALLLGLLGRGPWLPWPILIALCAVAALAMSRLSLDVPG